jgi:UDPglucose 6-dehydrogenase
MVNPEMVMIGTEDGSETGDAKELVDFYKTIMQNTPRYIIGTWDETECIKVFYNTFISAKVSLVNMIQDVAENLGNINAEVVCDALATSDRRIMGPGYMKPGMGDGGACHPRDNIALRWMAEELNLGYDLFDAVMLSREKQAENMSRRLCDLAEGDWHPTTRTMIGALPVVIVGKAYKPLVEYEAGSASMLVGHYVKNSGHELHYYDEKTGDMPPQSVLDKPAVYLLAHNPGITYGDQLDTVPGWYGDHKVTDCDDALVSTGNGTELNFAPGSIVVDPWRKTPDIEGVEVIHYGNTRGK